MFISKFYIVIITIMKYRSDCFKKISPSYILFLLFFLWHRSISESDKTCFHFQNCLSPTAFRFHLFSVHKSNPFTLSCIHIILYFITFAFLLDFGITQYLLPEGGGGIRGGVGGRSQEVFCEGYHVVFGGMERRSVFERWFIENWPQWEGRGGRGVIIILQSLRGDQVNFIVTAKILRPPTPGGKICLFSYHVVDIQGQAIQRFM